ncbi:MAG: hypothetical protein IPO92_22135 [Saprospiraceae bacterium]|nr:hypothetical protein [Saprospiraceae bacterium]
MNIDPELQALFYQNIGKVFYAIAAADDKIHNEEVHQLRQLVNTEWLKLNGNKNKKDIDTMRQIKIVFFQLARQKRDPHECLMEFKSFMSDNKYLFTEPVKQLIWNTARSIASSFSGNNKSELVLLAVLASILKD